MTAFIAIFGHLMLNVWIGWLFVGFSSNNRTLAENGVASLLCGMYIETMIIASMLFIGIPLELSVAAIIAGAVTLTVFAWRKENISMPKLSTGKLKWYEWLLLLSIGEKIAFGMWKLMNTPLYFYDAMTHWSGRARSLFGSVNWSLNPESHVFLGFTGSKHYPLATTIWRAVTTVFNGSWNDIIARVDGLIFFIIIVAIVWLVVWRFSQIRWLAAVAAFMISSLPLQIWHAISGYSDITVEAFAVASLAALLWKDWFLAGMFAAGTAWAKNDGLVLHIPQLFIAAGLLQCVKQDRKGLKCFRGREEWKKIIRFLGGVLTIAPWIIFKYIHSLGLAPGDEKLKFHTDAPWLFWNTVMNGSSHSIFWMFVFVSISVTSIKMYKDKTGRALLGLFLTSLLTVAFVFSCTEAYIFLRNQMTIHRSMLQFYGVATIVTMYGIWLTMKRRSL